MNLLQYSRLDPGVDAHLNKQEDNDIIYSTMNIQTSKMMAMYAV